MSPLLLAGAAGTNLTAAAVMGGCEATPMTSGLYEAGADVLLEVKLMELEAVDGVFIAVVTARLDPTATVVGIV